MTLHTFTCIKCPLSCQIELTEDNGTITNIEGHTCPQGEQYAREEFINPVRMVTTTVVVTHGILPCLPVRSETPVPKNMVRKCIHALNRIRVQAPIACGDIIYEDILGTGINIIASRKLEKKED
jgi:CxxC motif-containing protein